MSHSRRREADVVRFAADLPHDLHRRLAAAAVHADVSRVELVREAIEDLLALLEGGQWSRAETAAFEAGRVTGVRQTVAQVATGLAALTDAAAEYSSQHQARP